MITVVEPARSRAFVTLARVQRDLPSADTETLTDLIAEASDAIVAFCDREFARMVVTEELPGDNRDVILLSRTPIAAVTAVREKDTTINPSGYRIYDPNVGQLQMTERVFLDTRPVIPWITAEVDVSRPGALDYAIDYSGGYLMPDDDLLNATIDADASDNAFVGTDMPLLASGDSIVVAGFTNSANNGRHRVVSRSATRIGVGSTLVTESGTAISFTCSTLPRDLQRACLDTVVTWFQTTGRDGTVVSEKIGDWSATYRGAANNDGSNEDTSGLPPLVAQRLRKWRRMA